MKENWNDVSVIPTRDSENTISKPYLTVIKIGTAYSHSIGVYNFEDSCWINRYIGPAYKDLVVSWMEFPYHPLVK